MMVFLNKIIEQWYNRTMGGNIMNKFINVETTIHEMNLIQLGAEVKVVNGKMIYVEFKLENDLEIAYVYHINKKGKYFLERIKPYPLPEKELETPEDVIELIRIDHDQFANVVKSHLRHIQQKCDDTDAPSSNLQAFIDVNQRLHQTMKKLEDLFLYFHLPRGAISPIEEDIDNIEQKITNLVKKCERIWFEKDPDNL